MKKITKKGLTSKKQGIKADPKIEGSLKKLTPELTRSIVEKFSALYQQRKSELPDPEVMEKELKSTAGVDEPKRGFKPSTVALFLQLANSSGHVDNYSEYNPEPPVIVLIPIDAPELKYFGSDCGDADKSGKWNRMFSNPSLITFLKNRRVEFILGIIAEPDSERMEKEGRISLSAIMLPIYGRDGHIFESIADKNFGSFRYERSRIDGWSVYESE